MCNGVTLYDIGIYDHKIVLKNTYGILRHCCGVILFFVHCDKKNSYYKDCQLMIYRCYLLRSVELL